MTLKPDLIFVEFFSSRPDQGREKKFSKDCSGYQQIDNRIQSL